MTEAEQIEAKRKDRQARLNDAWADLATSKSFRLVMEDAQLHFGMFKESFLPTDNFNPHAAAQRDGQALLSLHLLWAPRTNVICSL